MKILILLITVLTTQLTLTAQKLLTLEEGKPVLEGGLEYGYIITNEKNKSVKGEDFDRFELQLYVRNANACAKLYAFRRNNLGELQRNATYNIAEYTVRNATGKRLTAKVGRVAAMPINMMVQVDASQVNGSNNNNGFVQATIGNGIRANQSATNNIIVIVPKGERPAVQCLTLFLEEQQGTL